MKEKAAVAALILSSSAVAAVSGQLPPPQKRPGDKTTANNARLQKAYVALRALKRTITEDPKKVTRDWSGPDVCAYFGVYH